MTLEPVVPPKLPPHVVQVKNKVGRPYLYLMKFRGTPRAEKAIRLPDDPKSSEFWAEYARAMQLPPAAKKSDTFEDLVGAWHASPEWRQLSEKTKIDWKRYSERIKASWGELQVRGIGPPNVLTLRDLYADTPASANNLIRCLSAMLAWSVPRGWRLDNPCREIKPLKGGSEYAPWPWEAIKEAEDRLREDLWQVAALALYTGQREDDVLSMLKTSIHANVISVRQEKTDKQLWIPIHRDLKPIIEKALARSPKTSLTILTNTLGRPWTADGFRTSWGKNKPPLVKKRGLVFHGLRKSSVVMLLEAGCSDAEVSSITGQSREMVEHYAKQVNQARLAASAILKWENASETEIANTVANTVPSKRAK
ncbi:tyrosine-type recombinase/integrase [Hyphomicrobium sp. ghe19]|uniref:tyrosine-type recombinase/integrase n=1 Tax=Hyphomicrobium sp. ghe19 TaxID=2682968 RepID=UPI0030D3ECCB